MSANLQERRLLPKNRVVAVFDLDGTLTFRDSLFPFLRFVARPRAVRRAVRARTAAGDAAAAGQRAAALAPVARPP